MFRSVAAIFLTGVLISLHLVAEDLPPSAPASKTEGAAPAKASEKPVQPGAMPSFPLTCESFGGIEDGYDSINENFDNFKEEMEIDLGPMTEILEALQASTQEHLKKNVDPNATFTAVMNQPSKFRGHVVKFAGALKIFQKTRAGSLEIWKGQTANIQRQIISFRCLEPLPPGISLDKPVELTGIFMQRFAYLNEEPGDRLRWTPLVYVRRIEPFVEPAEGIAFIDLLITGLSILACAGFGILFYFRVQSMNARPNHFTKVKSKLETRRKVQNKKQSPPQPPESTPVTEK